MLWRKSNIFSDVVTSPLEYPRTEEPSDLSEGDVLNHLTITQKADYATPPPQKIDHLRNVDTAEVTQSSTESFIEFYYLDENVDPISSLPKIKLTEITKINTERMDHTPGRLNQFKTFVSRSPLFAFRLNEPTYKRMSTSSMDGQRTTSHNILQAKPEVEMQMIAHNDLLQSFFERNMYPRYMKPSPLTTETTTTGTIITNYITKTAPTKSESPNDRVRFFEIYDSNTQAAVNHYTTMNSYNHNKIMKLDEKVELEQVDVDTVHSPNKTHYHYAKKHVKNRDIAQDFTQDAKSFMKINKSVENYTTSQQPNQTVKTTTKRAMNASSTTIPNLSSTTAVWNDLSNYTAKTYIMAAWSTYPFAAVYVYERYQVHCDAAAISPYWLISSAACISRHGDNPTGERSAFVAYCGENWWNPERIAYVKYTLVHPRYHPHDAARRHLYNVGVIQVASSMSSSCYGWAPVPIISHQYVADPGNPIGSAVGWGMNRYDTSYASRDLPKRPLAVYESYIHSGNCPGNSDYRNTKRIYEQAIANVYCLALPAYSGEDTDPVHGGLLLFGGKLIALYLQEERRRWGDQSAQYTGVWRLVPWVLDVAKDPEDLDFPLDR
ncbi:hypothetical protein O0L34_g16357 [Tuta absoluta]|nr:hypothetical protein O0L34_g16357 [Tuta absoluta]